MMPFLSPASLVMATAWAMQIQAATLAACMVPSTAYLWPFHVRYF